MKKQKNFWCSVKNEEQGKKCNKQCNYCNNLEKTNYFVE